MLKKKENKEKRDKEVIKKAYKEQKRVRKSQNLNKIKERMKFSLIRLICSNQQFNKTYCIHVDFPF